MTIDSFLDEALDTVIDSRVKQAMAYSLLAGGKRIRPQLLFDIAKGYGLLQEDVKYFACAIEMIHTYSLIHDDLPAMDNDDLRRGKPTCHKQFDEATAILAGDGLLTNAFQYASRTNLDSSLVCKAISILAQMAGANGMVYGQILDMNENPDAVWSDIEKVHTYKTGCLLSAPMMIGATLAHRSDDEIDNWYKVGVQLGIAFQIQDDIFDVELTAEEFGKSNSDTRNQKITSVTLLGEENAKQYMQQLFDDLLQKIQSFRDFDSSALLQTIETIQTRRK